MLAPIPRWPAPRTRWFQCFMVSVFQCFSVSVFQCLPRDLGGYTIKLLNCYADSDTSLKPTPTHSHVTPDSRGRHVTLFPVSGTSPKQITESTVFHPLRISDFRFQNSNWTIFRAAEAPPGPLSSKERGKRGLGGKGGEVQENNEKLTIDNTEWTIFRAAEAPPSIGTSPPGPLSQRACPERRRGKRGKRGRGVKGVRCMKTMKN